MQLKVCKEKCKYFKKHGHPYRRRHLRSRLDKAKSEREKEAEKRILDIIDREKQRLYWRQLDFKMRKSKGRSVRIVTDEDETSNVQEFEGKSNVKRPIFDRIYNKRFYAAEQSPIWKGPMQEAFGYLATTIAARQVPEGSYD